MSGFFKNNGTDSHRKKRERKSTAKVIAMKEMASLSKTTQKKKNEKPPVGKCKPPYFVSYHERKDGVLVKTFRCSKCAGFVGADRKECGRCIAKLEYERLKSMGLDGSIEMSKVIQQISKKKKKGKLDIAGNTKIVKPNIPKKAPKDGVKIKKDGIKIKKDGMKIKKAEVKSKKIGFKMNMFKKVTTKPFKSSKLQKEIKSVQKKSSVVGSPKKGVVTAKSLPPKMPKLKLEKQKKSVEALKLEMPKEIRPKSSKATKLQISAVKTQLSVPRMPTLIKQVPDENVANSSQILFRRKTDSNSVTPNTPRGEVKADSRKDTIPELKIQSKRKVDSQSGFEQKPSTSQSGMKKCISKNLGIKLEKYAVDGGKVQTNKSTKTRHYLQVTATPYVPLNDPITSLKAIEIPTVITGTQKKTPINESTKVKMYEKQQIIESNTAANSDVMTPRNIDKENLPKCRELFFSYLNLEQNSSRHQEELLSLPTKSYNKELVGIPEIMLDSNIIGKECFSGLLNSPNIEIIEEKDKIEKN